ncbi:hypothetical protein IAD21_02729 [Abditibacteriota bacterium]|nr:hypothetical protein IAD21_02729 [Abditibacteriota bacterium]
MKLSPDEQIADTLMDSRMPFRSTSALNELVSGINNLVILSRRVISGSKLVD